MGNLTTGLLGALVIGSLGSWLFLWAAKREGERWLGYLLIASLALKLLVVFIVTPVYYGHYIGNDSNTYDALAIAFAQHLKQGQWIPLKVGFNVAIYSYLTGMVYALFGPSRWLMEVLNAFISTLGVLFFYKGLRLALPPRQVKPAIYLIALMPSLLLWNSLHLRDPWMFFSVGLFTYGAAMSMGKRWLRPLVVLVLALVSMRLFRCYVSGVGVVAAIPLIILFKSRDRGRRALVIHVFGSVILGLIGAYLFWGAWTCTVGSQGLSPELLQQTQNALATGGSALIFGRFASWWDLLRYLPQGLINVLFRPFPWEAYNLPGLLASLENVLLFVLLIISLPQWLQLLRRERRSLWPGWVFLILLTGLFAIFEGNLGTIFRQKAQLMPFLLTLGALGLGPLWERLRAGRKGTV